jgi:hypothetical protein
VEKKKSKNLILLGNYFLLISTKKNLNLYKLLILPYKTPHMLLKSLLSTLFLISYLLPFTTSFSNLPMGTNTSAPKLQKRQDILLHSGYNVGFREARSPGGKIRTCTLGFAVKRVRGQGQFNHGYLTLSSCLSTRPGISVGRVHDVFIDEDGKGKELIVGTSVSSSSRYLPEESLNYALVRVSPKF